MYFNESNEDTNIDKEFKGKKSSGGFEFNESTKKLIKFAAIAIVAILFIIIVVLLIKNRTRYYLTIEGSENITIYQGTTYIEPGYIATDSKGNDASSLVRVDGTVDSNTIGTYNLTYTLQKLTRTRTVVVVSPPAVKTIIHLIGKPEMHIKVGQKFVDPGYTATDTTDGDITNNVKVSKGNINTSKKGVYRIVYSVVNSAGVTTSETRTVIVE